MFAKKEESQSDTKKCPQCGEEILKVAKKCKHCGAKLKRGWLKNILLLILVFIIFTFIAALNKGSNTPTTSQAPTVDIAQLKATAQAFSYEDMARYPENYKGKYVTFTGEVIQKMDNILRVNVTKGEYGMWSDTVYVTLKDANARILENDVVKMWGVADGLESYKAVMGNKITIPRVIVYAAEVTAKE